MSARIRMPAPNPHWAFFFDVDGTVVDLAPSPSLVRLDEELHALLRRLHQAAGGALALVSGRTIEGVDAIFTDSPLPVAGQHGLERRDARGTVTRFAADASELCAVKSSLAQDVARHPGLLMEDKGMSLALHYREAPRLGSYVSRAMRLARERMGTGYELQRGKFVVELKPSVMNKGRAVRAYMAEAPFQDRLPVFIGDDATDEHGFEAVNALGGLSIKVGAGASRACFRLADVVAVKSWLARGERERVPFTIRPG